MDRFGNDDTGCDNIGVCMDSKLRWKKLLGSLFKRYASRLAL